MRTVRFAAVFRPRPRHRAAISGGPPEEPQDPVVHLFPSSLPSSRTAGWSGQQTVRQHLGRRWKKLTHVSGRYAKARPGGCEHLDYVDSPRPWPGFTCCETSPRERPSATKGVTLTAPRAGEPMRTRPKGWTPTLRRALHDLHHVQGLPATETWRGRRTSSLRTGLGEITLRDLKVCFRQRCRLCRRCGAWSSAQLRQLTQSANFDSPPGFFYSPLHSRPKDWAASFTSHVRPIPDPHL